MAKEKTTDEFKVGYMLKRFNYIEFVLNKILTNYIQPKDMGKTSFVRDYLLHNSIVNFASKVKLFIKLNDDNKWININQDKLNKLYKYRNAIAHSHTNKVNVLIDLGKVKNGIPESKTYYNVESMKANGQMEVIERAKLFQDFLDLINYTLEKFREAAKKIS